ncbi:MAG: DNA methyltransferase [Solirubrobacteraceae bacterium]
MQLPVEGLEIAPRELVAKRSGPLYGVHSYHTKIPPSAIAASILRHSARGALVLDPFSGSGMTGVAAALHGRRAILNDLSPAAVHIARNYTAPCSADGFLSAVQRVLRQVGPEIESFYLTSEAGAPATVEYLVWSDVRRCPACATDVLLWDARAEGLRRLRCPDCAYETAKTDFKIVGERAVEANLSVVRGPRIVRSVREEDLGLDRLPPDLPWVPETPFSSERPMWRRGHRELGIDTLTDFYSRRNLAAFALLWREANAEPDERLREALRFSLTAIANRASRRYQWNSKRPTNVLGGTLYVSSLRYEWNVLSLWKRKTAAVARLFRENPMPAGAVDVLQGSATDLPLADSSVDYVFTDPPFGAHIVYSDSSLLWESWLDDYTDRDREAIVVSGGDTPKKIADYETLLRGSFAEIRRVLKPKAQATVVFQATDPEVWAAIQRGAVDAGLDLIDATTLDKGQPSFKQIKGQGGERVASADIVLTLAKRGKNHRTKSTQISPLEALRKTMAIACAQKRSVPIGKLFALVNARLLASGAERIVTYDELHALLREHHIEEDGRWKGKP